MHSNKHYARFECENGATFSIHKQESINNKVNAWVYFEVENVDEKIVELIKQDVLINEMPNDKPWLWREARVLDLDNNIIIIYHAGENRLNPPWKIKT